MNDIVARLKALPHHVKPYDQWLDHEGQYDKYAKVFGAIAPYNLFEIGTAVGYSAVTAALASPSTLGRIEWVDDESYAPGTNRMAVENIRSVNPEFNPRYWTSLEASAGEARTPDLIHIDGDHTEVGCRRDLEWVYDLWPGVCVIGHDYLFQDYGVRDAVRGHCVSRRLTHVVLLDFFLGLYVIPPDGGEADLFWKLANAGVGRLEVVPCG